MPIIKSAKKRVKVARKATVRNAKVKRSLKEAVKAFQKSANGDKKNAAELQRQAQSAIAKAGKKNVMHKNKVARKQSQLAKAAKAAGVKPTATSVKKTVAAKPATSKVAAAKKTTTTKKPAAKKAPTKK